jgi:transcription termination factor NusB
MTKLTIFVIAAGHFTLGSSGFLKPRFSAQPKEVNHHTFIPTSSSVEINSSPTHFLNETERLDGTNDTAVNVTTSFNETQKESPTVPSCLEFNICKKSNEDEDSEKRCFCSKGKNDTEKSCLCEERDDEDSEKRCSCSEGGSDTKRLCLCQRHEGNVTEKRCPCQGHEGDDTEKRCPCQEHDNDDTEKRCPCPKGENDTEKRCLCQEHEGDGIEKRCPCQGRENDDDTEKRCLCQEHEKEPKMVCNLVERITGLCPALNKDEQPPTGERRRMRIEPRVPYLTIEEQILRKPAPIDPDRYKLPVWSSGSKNITTLDDEKDIPIGDDSSLRRELEKLLLNIPPPPEAWMKGHGEADAALQEIYGELHKYPPPIQQLANKERAKREEISDSLNGMIDAVLGNAVALDKMMDKLLSNNTLVEKVLDREEVVEKFYNRCAVSDDCRNKLAAIDISASERNVTLLSEIIMAKRDLMETVVNKILDHPEALDKIMDKLLSNEKVLDRLLGHDKIAEKLDDISDESSDSDENANVEQKRNFFDRRPPPGAVKYKCGFPNKPPGRFFGGNLNYVCEPAVPPQPTPDAYQS